MLLEDRGTNRDMVEFGNSKHVVDFPLKIFAKFWAVWDRRFKSLVKSMTELSTDL